MSNGFEVPPSVLNTVILMLAGEEGQFNSVNYNDRGASRTLWLASKGALGVRFNSKGHMSLDGFLEDIGPELAECKAAIAALHGAINKAACLYLDSEGNAPRPVSWHNNSADAQ